MKKGIKNKNGFTLIELLAVIVILGLLMAIAIPSVTKYITQSRKKTVSTTIDNYMGALTNQVNDMEYTFTATDTVYAVPIECISLERGGTNPFGKWHQSNDAYWAYVLVQYDDATSSYTYGFTFKDSAGYGLYPTTSEKLKESGSQILTDLNLSRPTNGKITNITVKDNWLGFNVTNDTNLVVLVASSEGQTGNGTTTCTLCQKGDNYDLVEAEKVPQILTFSIGGVTYQFEEGMTWKEWINSKYHTSDFFLTNDEFVRKGQSGDLTNVFYSCPVLNESQIYNTSYIDYQVRSEHQIFAKKVYYTSSMPADNFCSDFCSKEPYYIFEDSDGNLTYIEN